jgi:excisionase family DNA binding protein
MTSTYFTPATLAARWLCSPRTVRNLVQQGKIPATRIGDKLIRISREDVEAYECRLEENALAKKRRRFDGGKTGGLDPIAWARKTIR